MPASEDEAFVNQATGMEIDLTSHREVRSWKWIFPQSTGPSAMTLKRTALSIALIGIATLGSGCASTPSQNAAMNSSTVRFAMLDSDRNPLAMGAGDTLGASLFLSQEAN